MTDWTEQAACRGMDPSIHHPPIDDRVLSAPRSASAERYADAYAAARAVCARCPVAGDCLAYAIDNAETYGMWGGMDPRERHGLVGRRRRCSECGRGFTLPSKSNRSICGRAECEVSRRRRYLADQRVREGRDEAGVGFPAMYRATSPVDWSTVPSDDPRSRAADAALNESLVAS